jgi:hypothetical protein
MSVADLVDEIFRLYRANAQILFGVSAVIWLPASVVFFILQLTYFSNIPQFDPTRVLTPQELSDTFTDVIGALAVAFVVGVVAAPLLLAAITSVVSARYLGRPITIGAAVRRSFACYFRILASYAVVFIVATTASIVLTIIGSILVAVIANMVGGTIGGVIGVLLVFVIFVAAFAVFVWLITTWTLTGQAIVIEDTGALRSLSRSRGLVAGSRWRVIGINILLFLIQIVLFSVPSTLVAIIAAPLPMPLGPAVSEVVTVTAQIAYFPVQLGTLTLLYYDLRVRKEGFDLKFAAEQLAPA